MQCRTTVLSTRESARDCLTCGFKLEFLPWEVKAVIRIRNASIVVHCKN